MTASIIPVSPFDLVIFGSTGDLTRKKLLPALARRFHEGQIPPSSRIVAVSRREQTTNAYRDWTREALREFAPELNRESVNRFLECVACVVLPDGASDQNDAHRLALRGAMSPPEKGVVRAFYMATPSSEFERLCEQLARWGMLSPESRVILEKPIGTDLHSAAAINGALSRVLTERQTYRIDHYLGKETVQNLMVLRFANTFFEPIWNSLHVDHVQITVAESIGVEGRTAYYDNAGALRDMVQNHVLQLLCLCAMEPPGVFEADVVRTEKLKVLHALAPIGNDRCRLQSVRGQYVAGSINGHSVPGYLDDLRLQQSHTETFVAVKAEVANWRWSHTPFYLRTGKRMKARCSEIVIQFRTVPHWIFPPDTLKGASTDSAANRLVIRLQPDEGVQMLLTIKEPGPGGLRMVEVPLDLSFSRRFEGRLPEAYERLVMDVVRGNQTLFMSWEEVAAAWRWTDHLLASWAQVDQPLESYAAGSWGPASSAALMAHDRIAWYNNPHTPAP